MQKQRLFIVSNRLPISIMEEGGTLNVVPSSGGLVTAVNSFVAMSGNAYKDITWVGVPGCSPTSWAVASRQLPQTAFRYMPVMVFKEQYDHYYNGFANSTLWPLCHYFPSYAEYSEEDYQDYLQVNEHFAETLEGACVGSDIVWIHDYHLLPLAARLRRSIPGLTIGFFLHIPFPSYELFRLMPRSWQQNLLEGMLGADLVGFHTMDYAAHFLQSVQMVLGLNQDRNIIRQKDRLVKVDVFPISIDFDRFSQAYQGQEVATMRQKLQVQLHGRKLIFSVDRLDYSKGVHHRLKAYECFLKQSPAYRGKVVFIIVVVPSRDNIARYAERKRMIDELISNINSEVGDITWQPVIYQYNALSFSEMVGLYTACDVALITPLRDGMNLVSKEFVASRADENGVLVLSEMAGAARELSDALLINPNDTRELAGKIREALEMDTGEQTLRMAQMRSRIAHYTVKDWGEDFMSELQHIKEIQEQYQELFLAETNKRKLLDSYSSAHRRLLLLDYDGTLVSFCNNPTQAVPGNELLDLLRSLASKESHEVWLISGRSSAWLEQYFGHLPVGLIAEHGAKMKQQDGAWNTEVPFNSEWKEAVCNIMERYVRRCAHTFIEDKEFSIVWHYRNADPFQGRLRSSELAAELNKYLIDRQLEVVCGNKIVEVRNRGTNKGTAIRKLLATGTFDWIFAAGDDKTDEDMFKILTPIAYAHTIKVGPNASYARYNLLRPQMVVDLLRSMSELPVMQVI